MKQIILGTAGHIDHGKTSLIKAVTGINTDRLKEEQARGITIELGFAALDLPDGQHVGIVDVPGHEKFVKNMVAGATGIDIVTMVIAADEGVMPQTREHMEICSLLGVAHGFVALTKIDMVDAEWLELAIEDVRTFTRQTFLADAPIVPVSSVTGAGLAQWRDTLADICVLVPERSTTGMFRLPVDRVFTMTGFGTVITGTLAAGSVAVGDTVELMPAGIRSKVRGLQVHNAAVERAFAGQRTAINFQGVDRTAVTRGDVVSAPDTLKGSYMLDVHLHLLPSAPKPLKNRARVRCHTGTNETIGMAILLDRDELTPGETAVAQIRLDAPVCTVRDDRFVIRSYSPIRTIGGGCILHPNPTKHKRHRAEAITHVTALIDAPAEGIIDQVARSAAFAGIGFADLRLTTNLADKALEATLAALLSQRRLILVDRDQRIVVHADVFADLCTAITDRLTAYHRAHPLKAGMPKEELKSKCPPTVGIKLFSQGLQHLVKTDVVAINEDQVRMTGHQVTLAADQADIQQAILAAYRAAGIQPPPVKELVTTHGFDAKQTADVLRLLVDRGDLIRVKDDLVFDAQALSALRHRLVTYLKEHGEITTPAFKDMTGASRKYVIPLIEFFDSQKVTIRIGDIRQLRNG